MIIEFFGPPGSGKTTTAHALAQSLTAHGYPARVAFSYRPGEGAALDPGGSMAAILRVLRACVETSVMALFFFENREDFAIVFALIQTVPPQNTVWMMRFGQYILRLAHHWRHVRQTDSIVIFDQGFVQAVCSLAIFRNQVDEASLARAIDLIPRADMAIRLIVPPAVLEARLYDRLAREAPAERLFEAAPQTNLKAVDMAQSISRLLSQRGVQATEVISATPDQLEHAVEQIERQIVEQLRLRAKIAVPRGIPAMQPDLGSAAE